jgi:hypothetical protein
MHLAYHTTGKKFSQFIQHDENKSQPPLIHINHKMHSRFFGILGTHGNFAFNFYTNGFNTRRGRRGYIMHKE